MADILLAEDDASLRLVLGRALSRWGHDIREVADGDAALQHLLGGGIDLVLLDVRMPRRTGLEVLKAMGEAGVSVPSIVLTAHGTPANAIAAMQAGAWEYLTKPVDLIELEEMVGRVLHQARETTSSAHVSEDKAPGTGAGPGRSGAESLLGRSRAMQGVFKLIGRVARSRVSVLLVGPSGSGKELVARTIHSHSDRANKPFVAVNMPAIPETLLEAELFGHRKGAFTGADRDRPGTFQQADGGTLFLDEIGEMPMALQARLLRALQEGCFYPVGATRPVEVDVRILSATHRDLRSLVRQGAFREDLYHRLNVVPIELPGLTERRDDIPDLATHFVGRACRELGIREKRISVEALAWLQEQTWTGHVRELRNVITRAVALCPGPELSPSDFGREAAATGPAESLEALVYHRLLQEDGADEDTDLMDRTVGAAERAAIRRALERTGGSQSAAARLLGVSRNTLRTKLARHRLDPAAFRSAND